MKILVTINDIENNYIYEAEVLGMDFKGVDPSLWVRIQSPREVWVPFTLACEGGYYEGLISWYEPNDDEESPWHVTDLRVVK